MKNMKHLLTSITVVAVLGGYSGMGWAEQDKAGDYNLSEFTCKDVMRLEGENRSVAVALFHGYLLGKKGAIKFNSENLATTTDKFIDHCLDNPASIALESMAKVSK